MDLSVIVLTWNSERYVEACVRSALSSLRASALEYEIIVMDNGSSDATPSLLRGLAQEFATVQVQYLPVNLGTTIPRNRALKWAKGRYLCIMDSDVEVDRGVFAELLTLLREDATLGLVVPRVVYPSGLLQKSCDRFPTLLHKVHRLLRLRSMELQEHEQQMGAVENQPVDYAISAFWLFPRKLLETVGFLDEKIFYSPEDVDYCLRIWKAGYQVLYVPAVAVVHHTQEISRGWKLNRSKISHLKGLLYLFAKHRYFFVTPKFKVKPQHTKEGIS